MEIETPLGQLTLNIGGTIDRMDSKEDTLRIVDYKTGGTPKVPETSSSSSRLPKDARTTFSKRSCMRPSYAANNR